MNKNQFKGSVKILAGKLQEKVGEMAGSKKQQVKGLNKQISGKAEKSFGDAQAAIKMGPPHP